MKPLLLRAKVLIERYPRAIWILNVGRSISGWCIKGLATDSHSLSAQL